MITRPHPTWSRIGFGLVAVPIGMWMIHLTYSAAAVKFTCSHPEWHWTLYAITVATGAVVLVTSAWSLRLVHVTADGDEQGDREVDQLAFLGRLGVFVGVINLVLIVAEGILVPFLSSCA